VATDLLLEAQRLVQQADAHIEAFVEGMLPGQQEREHTAARLKRVEKLAKRWGLPLVGCASSLLRGGANAQARIKSASANQSRRAELTQHADALRARLLESARNLSMARRATIPSLVSAMQDSLSTLGMPHSRFHILLEDRAYGADAEPDSSTVELRLDCATSEDPSASAIPTARLVHCTPYGIDRIHLLLSAGSQEELRPLALVGSGGERSRIMLAFKTLLATPIVTPAASECSPSALPISVYDELDTGVGGRLGGLIGQHLRRLCNKGHQVLCITHLPQVAVHGDMHLRVSKGETADGRMVSSVDKLTNTDQRLNEIASMLDLGRASAQALIDAAAQKREENHS